MEDRTYFVGVWVTLAATIIQFLPFIGMEFPIEITLAAPIIALIGGFYSLRIIHKHSKFFKGEWIVIPCIIVSALMLMVSLILIGFTLFIPESETVSIHSDEDAVKFALEMTDENMSDMGMPTVIRPPLNSSAVSSRLENLSVNASEVFTVRWEKSADSVIRTCSTTFTDEGYVLEDFGCILR